MSKDFANTLLQIGQNREKREILTSRNFPTKHYMVRIEFGEIDISPYKHEKLFWVAIIAGNVKITERQHLHSGHFSVREEAVSVMNMYETGILKDQKMSRRAIAKPVFKQHLLAPLHNLSATF